VRDQNAKTTVMRSIANSAYTGALGAVRPYLASDDPFLRAAAVEALRLMDNPKVDPLIADRLANDKQIVVRNAALTAAAPRSPSPVLLGAVEGVAARSSDTQGRLNAVRLLARWLPERDAAVRPALQRIATSDQEPKVREAAKRALERTL